MDQKLTSNNPKISFDHHLKSGEPVEVVLMYFYALCCEATTPTEPQIFLNQPEV